MLGYIANKCTNNLLAHQIISEKERPIYHYGFELFFSTTFCIISILLLGAIFGYFPLSITFIFFFVPIRIVAGGYHASSYGKCFLLTNSIAIMCVLLSKILLQKLNSEYILWIMLIGCTLYIWKNAPVISKKYPQKQERIIKNKRYAKIVLLIDLLCAILFKVFLGNGVFSLITVTYCAVMIMMIFSERRGNIWRRS